MDERNLSRTTGSVILQLGALEVLTRFSMNSGRATSVLSSLHEFKVQEAEKTGGKQWNWKYLRDQFDQKDLEGLYRKYDEKLRETFLYIYMVLLITITTLHILVVVISTYSADIQWRSTFLSMAMYIIRIAIPTIFLWKYFYEPLKQKWFWIPILISVIVTIDLVVTDIAISIYSAAEGMALRPAYSTMALLSIYIFLPMRNNFLAIILGFMVSIVYVFIFAFYTYVDSPNVTVVIASDVIYQIGVNLMGVYFRLMNEIITRRSFLDRRACVESTLRLKFEKDHEERLMLSILPEHIVSRVRHDIRNLFLGIQSHNLSTSMRSFNQLYVEEHDNVSILYADVVNYTMISTTLSPMRMVELLNELFGRFDEASQEHDVLRIKFLGDCYYCVSGIPKPTEEHAKNCVDLGLEMINIIKDVREKRSLDIDMRIGVHSGRILCGLIGIRKWQFDIWSKDVTIANKMESTGKAGKVHVTKQTLELLLNYAREYIIEPNFASQEDPFIANNQLETYLLSRPLRFPVEYKPYRRVSVGFTKMIKSSRRPDVRSSSNYRRTSTFMDENLVEYQQMLKAADAQMTKEIDDIQHGREQYKKESKMNRITLIFNNFEMEKSFLHLPDPLFKYYILCCLIISVLIILINCLTTDWFSGFEWYAWLLMTILLTALIVIQPFTWFQFLWTKYRGIDEPRDALIRKIYDISLNITKSAKTRTVIYLLISIGLAGTSVTNVISCREVRVDASTETESVLSNCVSSWHVTQCWGLALLLNFLFSRVFFIFKWIVAGGMTLFYLWVVWELKSNLFSLDATWNVGVDPRISHSLSVIFITVGLYWIDRTTEYRNRLDYLWKIQLKEEQEEAQTMLKVNSMLLENILPAHVAQVYLDLNRSVDELYYEKYDNVAVMFASLTDYKLGVENDAELSDKIVLSILDEVISDFDRLLLTGQSVYKVEKIKMAGWTYMAACGLDPNRRGSFDSASYNSAVDKRQNNPYNRAIVVTMVEFAAAMMKQLQSFNRGSFQSFEGLNLRIGVSNGEVAAGVVGSLKPLYDIWGHAVNMASRMDSTGEKGRIQVTENTAVALDECGILTTYRGETFVKGAGNIKTYFVPLDEHFHLFRKENSADFYKTDEKQRHYNARNMDYSLKYGFGNSSSDSESNESEYSTYVIKVNDYLNNDTSYSYPRSSWEDEDVYNAVKGIDSEPIEMSVSNEFTNTTSLSRNGNVSDVVDLSDVEIETDRSVCDRYRDDGLSSIAVVSGDSTETEVRETRC